jgi:putative transposase
MSNAKTTKMLNRLETQDRRSNMETVVRSLKVDESKLSKLTKQFIDDLFEEAKWIKNNAISNGIFNVSDKLKEVEVHHHTLNGEVYTTEPIKRMQSQMQQDAIKELQGAVKSLSTKKNKNEKVGKINHIKQVDSVNLKQLKSTHRFAYGTKMIKGDEKQIIKKVKLAKCKSWMSVRGGEQLLGVDEIANAKLVRKPSGLYIQVTCCIKKERFEEWKASFANRPSEFKKEAIACDLGIKTTIVVSDCEEKQYREEFNIKLSPTKLISILQRKRCKMLEAIKQMDQYKENKYFRTSGYIELLQRLRKAYETLTNKRKNKAKEIVGSLERKYETIVFQDENINGWAKGWFGKQVQHSALGTIKSELKRLVKRNRAVMLDRFAPTTKLCYACDHKVSIILSERTFVCNNCGFTDDRDFKSADTMLVMAGFNLKKDLTNNFIAV